MQRSSLTGEFNQIYHLGIIDYLQAYNFNKKIERMYKRIKHPRVPVTHMSTAPCEIYQQRFERFISQRVLIDKSS